MVTDWQGISLFYFLPTLGHTSSNSDLEVVPLGEKWPISEGINVLFIYGSGVSPSRSRAWRIWAESC